MKSIVPGGEQAGENDKGKQIGSGSGRDPC